MAVSTSSTASIIAILALVLGLAGCGHSPEVVEARYEPAPVPAADNHLAEGISLYRSGHLNKAENHLTTALAHDPSEWAAHYFLGLVLAENDKPDSSSMELHRALDLAPNDGRTRSRIYYALGRTNERLGYTGKARLAYMTALNLWPDSHSARQALRRLNEQALRSDK